MKGEKSKGKRKLQQRERKQGGKEVSGRKLRRTTNVGRKWKECKKRKNRKRGLS